MAALADGNCFEMPNNDKYVASSIETEDGPDGEATPTCTCESSPSRVPYVNARRALASSEWGKMNIWHEQPQHRIYTTRRQDPSWGPVGTNSTSSFPLEDSMGAQESMTEQSDTTISEAEVEMADDSMDCIKSRMSPLSSDEQAEAHVPGDSQDSVDAFGRMLDEYL